MNPIDFWFSMGSTYTYLSVSRLPVIQRTSGVSFRWRPFNLMRIFREANYFPFKEGANKTKHMWQDLSRRATLHNVPLNLPVEYPARESFRANRIAIVGLKEGWGEAFVRTAYRLWFVEGLPNGSEENVARTLRDLGQDRARVLEAATRDEIGQLFESETDEAHKLGVFGSPTFVVNNQLFWGDDRLEDAISLYEKGRE